MKIWAFNIDEPGFPFLLLHAHLLTRREGIYYNFNRWLVRIIFVHVKCDRKFDNFCLHRQQFNEI